MEINVEKIGMIKENFNPKNTDVNLDIDWSVEYKNTDQKNINYDIILKSVKYFNLNFKMEGFIRLDFFEEFNQQLCSQIIFNHACSMLMNVISLTKQQKYDLLTEELNSTVNLQSTF